MLSFCGFSCVRESVYAEILDSTNGRSNFARKELRKQLDLLRQLET